MHFGRFSPGLWLKTGLRISWEKSSEKRPNRGVQVTNSSHKLRKTVEKETHCSWKKTVRAHIQNMKKRKKYGTVKCATISFVLKCKMLKWKSFRKHLIFSLQFLKTELAKSKYCNIEKSRDLSKLEPIHSLPYRIERSLGRNSCPG